MKCVHGAWMPFEETELPKQLEQMQGLPRFAGGPTYQLRKFFAACPYVQTFDHAVDVGANVGLWSRVLARCFERVSSFEPMEQHHECFWKNIDQNDHKRIDLYKVAVGDRTGNTAMLFQGMHTHVATTDEGLVEGTTSVKMYKLDDMNFEALDFLKIDVEGYEYQVVTGGAETIQRFKPVIIIEQKDKGNANRYGKHEQAACGLLQKWGADVVFNYGGDLVMRWKKQSK